MKYFWGKTVWHVVKDKKLDLLELQLDSISSDSLNIPNIMAKYMCQYRGSLIGKHFKTIVQVLPMVIYNMVPKDLLVVWLIMGRLVVLCRHMEIKDVSQYMASSLF